MQFICHVFFFLADSTFQLDEKRSLKERSMCWLDLLTASTLYNDFRYPHEPRNVCYQDRIHECPWNGRAMSATYVHLHSQLNWEPVNKSPAVCVKSWSSLAKKVPIDRGHDRQSTLRGGAVTAQPPRMSGRIPHRNTIERACGSQVTEHACACVFARVRVKRFVNVIDDLPNLDEFSKMCRLLEPKYATYIW